MTKRQRAHFGKKIVKWLSGTKLLVNAHDPFQWSTQQIYSDSVIECIDRELRISGSYPLRWFRIDLEAVTDIKEFQIKRYEIVLSNGATITLSEFFD